MNTPSRISRIHRLREKVDIGNFGVRWDSKFKGPLNKHLYNLNLHPRKLDMFTR